MARKRREFTHTMVDRDEIKAYIGQQNISEMMETVLKATINARPSDVPGFMAKEFKRISDAADKPAVFFVLVQLLVATVAIDNGLGTKPPMGWRSWVSLGLPPSINQAF